MRNFHTIIFIIFFILFCCARTNAQENYSLNFNIENGLPSNHVYGTITDRNGYLWIATDKGVVKYNGYDFKIFNLSDGLPTEDIWQLTEDNKGKIWLSNISDEFGYIYNNKYHKAINKGPHGTIYPICTRSSGDCLIFISNYINGNRCPSVCIEKNDTIHQFQFTEQMLRILGIPDLPGYRLHYQIINDDLCQPIIDFGGSVYQAFMQYGNIKFKRLINIDSTSCFLDIFKTRYLGDYLISYNSDKSNKIFTRNLKNDTTEEINLDSICNHSNIQYISTDNSNKIFYVIFKEFILKYKYLNGLNFACKINVRDLITDKKINGSNIRTILWSKFWGNCLCTTNSGLWLNDSIKNNFVNEQGLDLHEYKFVGSLTDSMLFLWNQDTHILAIIDNKYKIKYYHYNANQLLNIRSIIPYNRDTFLCMGISSHFFLKNDPANMIKICNKTLLHHTVADTYTAIKNNEGKVYMIGQEGFFSIDLSHDNTGQNYIDHDRYRYLLLDSLKQSYWAYNHDKVFIHKKDKNIIIVNKQLSNFGIQKIEKIAIDNKYGNILFKGTNNITLYDEDKNKYSRLFKNINLKESFISVYHDLLIVTGQFGVLFCKILGPQKISPPLVYPNLKNAKYNVVYNSEAFCGKVLINTDKGTFEVAIPGDNEILNNAPDSTVFNYKFIVNYRNNVSDFKSGDTLLINQNYLRILFDVINPFGNGNVKYTYKFSNDSALYELNGNELVLTSNLIPDRYYNIYITTYDNVFRSNFILMHVYIQPYWWQTKIGRRLIWLGITFGILLILAIAVLVTRIFVLNAAKKRSLRLELELKAIYAQINPHFIFNALNSALLMVKKNKLEEAYDHISKFSRLLRGYIKSSRNKLISLNDELNNLKDYIELQQTRFKNKFDYEITVESKIEQDKIMIPSLLIQPFVENAINHGILPNNENGHLKIEFTMTKDKNEVICTIEDNGIGRKRSKAINDNSETKDASYGDLLIKDLVSIFNKYENINIDFWYTDKDEPKTGTIVTIKIKNPQYAK